MTRNYSPWLRGLLAVMGGIALGYGVGRLASGIALGPALSTVFGVILLWWAINDPRKAQPDTPESEVHGDHTVE